MVKEKDYKLISKSKYFDKKWYLKTYPAVKETGLDPALHYLTIGWKEGKNPSPNFDTNDYLNRYPDVKNANINPLFHYERYGKKEGRNLQTKSTSISFVSKETKYKSPLFHRIKNKLETLCFDYNIYKIKPRFSIIMPTYNRAFCICDAIDSLLNQTYQNFELIIVDDGSTDGTQELLQQRYKKELESAKIHYIFQENTGVCKARNMGLHHAKNEWISYLDSDNILAKDYLKTFAIAINKYMKNNLFYAKLICQSNKYIVGQKFNRKRLLSHNYIDLGVFVHHKDLYEKLGGFDENMTRLVDWELIIRYTETESPIFVDRVVLLYNDFDGHDRISNSKNYDENLKYLKAKHNI